MTQNHDSPADPKDDSIHSASTLSNIVGDIQDPKIAGRDIIIVNFQALPHATAIAAPQVVSADEEIPACPYRGLLTFRPEDVKFFFGREKFVADLVHATEGRNLVVVLGASGSGKSSAVFAGLVPLLNPSNQWLFTTFRPGKDPYLGLSRALVPLYVKTQSETKQMIEARRLSYSLQNGELQLADVIDTIHQKGLYDRRLLIIADQFEEIYTLCHDMTCRSSFLDVMLQINSFTNVHLVLTLRADFMGQASLYRPFADALQGTTELLGPMDRAEMAQAIEKPANLQGVGFEDKLVDRLLDDVGEEEGSLPLLEFALFELWQHQQGRLLTHAAYEEIGQVKGALSRHAEKVFQGLTTLERKRASRVFVQLVNPGLGTEDTRRLTSRSELEEDWALVAKLASKRLVVTNKILTDQPETEPEEKEKEKEQEQDTESVELVHEALIRHWRRLQRWMNADRAFRAWQERLRFALHQWEEADHDEDSLLRGVPLAEAEEWLDQREADLIQSEREFIRASQQREAKRIAQRRRARLYGLAAIGTIFLLIIVALGIGLWSQRLLTQQGEEQAKELGIALATAQAAEANAQEEQTRAQAFAEEKGIALATAQAAEAIAQEAGTKAREAGQLAIEQLEIAKVALARQLAIQAETLYDQQADLSQQGMLLAIESWHLARSFEGRQALRNGLAHLPRLLAEFEHEGGVLAVAFDLNGNRLITTDTQGVIRMRDIATGEIVNEIQPGSGQVNPLLGGFPSINGKWLVTIQGDSSEEEILVWDLARGEVITKLKYTGTLLLAVAISSDGHWLATGDFDGKVRVWEVSTGQEVVQISLTDSEQGSLISVLSLAFSLDGNWLAAGGLNIFDQSGEIQIRAVTTGEEIARISQEKGVSSLALSPDKHWLAIGTGDLLGSAGEVQVWEVASKQIVARMPYERGVRSLAFSPDSRWLATGTGLLPGLGIGSGIVMASNAPSSGEEARVWDLTTGQVVAQVTHEDAVTSIAFSPNGKWLAVGGQFAPHARIWDISAGDANVTLAHERGVDAIAFSPDGKLLATSESFGPKRLWDVTLGSVVTEMDSGMLESGNMSLGSSLAFSPDGHWLAEGGGYCIPITPHVWNVSTGEEGEHTGNKVAARSVAFSPNSQWLAAGGEERDDGDAWSMGPGSGLAEVWDVDSGEIVVEISTELPIYSVAFSPNGMWLATGSGGASGAVQMWDLNTGEEVSKIAHPAGVSAVTFSPDGQWLAFGSIDGTVQIRKVGGWEKVAQVVHPAAVESLTFSPDSQWLAAGGGGFCDMGQGNFNEVWVWNVPTGDAIAHLPGIQSVAFSPDGKWLATALGGLLRRQTEVRLIFWQPEDIIEEACRRLNRNLTREEWEQAYGERPYEKTCPNLPAAPGLIERAEALATAGRIEEALELFKEALAIDPDLGIDPEAEVRRLAVPGFIERGETFASQGQVEEALAQFAKALELDPDIGIEPMAKVRELSVPTLVKQGRDLASEGKVDESLAKFAEGLELDPDYPLNPELEIRELAIPALIERGRSLASEGLVEEAQAQFDKVFELDPDYKDLDPEEELRQLAIPGLVEKGKQLARDGQMEESLAAFQAALELDPSHNVGSEIAEFLVNRAEELLDPYYGPVEDGTYAEALTLYQKAVEFDPSLDLVPEAEVALAKGRALAQDGQIDEALTAFEQAIQSDPALGAEVAEILVNQARDLLGPYGGLVDDEAYAEALTLYQKAVEFDPSLDLVPEAEVALGKGQALAQDGQIDEALTAFEEAIQFDPTLEAEVAEILVNEAQILLDPYYRTDDEEAYAEALTLYQKAVEFDPSLDLVPEAQIALAKGQALAQDGQIDEALTAFEEAIQFDPTLEAEVAEILVNEAQILLDPYYRTDDEEAYTEALTLYQKAVELDPSLDLVPEAEVALARGRALAQAGQIDEALAAFEEAIQLDPTLEVVPETEVAEILVNEAQILLDPYYRTNDEEAYDEALTLYQKAVELDPSLDLVPEAEVALAKGKALAWEGQYDSSSYDDALAAFQEAVQLDPELKHGRVARLASAYNEVCRQSVYGEPPEAILTACKRATELAVETDDPFLNLEICQNGDIDEISKIVSPTCDRVDELAVEIPFDDTVEGQIDPQAGEMWKFEGIQGQIITITLNATNKEPAPHLFLLGPDKKNLDEAYVYYDESELSIDSFILPETTPYLIGVGDDVSSAVAYTLTLVEASR
jgi:WD40 repeat protein/tetratricopeptide (TPR) repeat protein